MYITTESLRFSDWLLFGAGSFVKQEMPKKLNRPKSAGQIITKIVLHFASFFLSAMYCSTVIAMLFTKKLKPYPKNVYELTYKFSDLQVYIQSNSASYDYVRGLPYWKDLKDRVVVFVNSRSF